MSDDAKATLIIATAGILILGFVVALVYFDHKAREDCLDMGGRIHTWTTEEWSCSQDINGLPQCGWETVQHWKCVDLPAERRKPLP